MQCRWGEFRTAHIEYWWDLHLTDISSTWNVHEFPSDQSQSAFKRQIQPMFIFHLICPSIGHFRIGIRRLSPYAGAQSLWNHLTSSVVLYLTAGIVGWWPPLFLVWFGSELYLNKHLKRIHKSIRPSDGLPQDTNETALSVLWLDHYHSKRIPGQWWERLAPFKRTVQVSLPINQNND